MLKVASLCSWTVFSIQSLALSPPFLAQCTNLRRSICVAVAFLLISGTFQVLLEGLHDEGGEGNRSEVIQDLGPALLGNDCVFFQ